MTTIDCNTFLQTIAAISSAIAAFVAAHLAKSAFTFQKNSLLKKATVEQILKLLHQFHYLKSLAGQGVLDAPDENITGLRQKIFETKQSVMTLEHMICAQASIDMQKIHNIVLNVHEENIFARDGNMKNYALIRQLDEAISALQRIYHTEIR